MSLMRLFFLTAVAPAPNLRGPGLQHSVAANDLLAMQGLSQAATCPEMEAVSC